MKRDSFIDIIKFAFAIMIVLFHYGNNVLPGGRVAVEGFFMISGYLMMVNINSRKKTDEIGKETVAFLFRKYRKLAAFLIPAVCLVLVNKTLGGLITPVSAVKNLPFLLFEFIPVFSLGFQGYYILGISWYLSSMMFALAVLYPLCRKYGSSFLLTAGIPIVLFSYGLLSRLVGSLAVSAWISEPYLLPAGLIRGAAGCLAGCILYECVQYLRNQSFSRFFRIVIFVFEVLGYLYLIYSCRKQAQSAYDYFLVFLIFALLLAGLSGAAGLKQFYSSPKTGILGTISILLVLNHFQWTEILLFKSNEKGMETYSIWIYLLFTGLSCIACYLVSLLCGRLIKLAGDHLRRDK